MIYLHVCDCTTIWRRKTNVRESNMRFDGSVHNYFFCHVLFQFLCNLQQYCDSAYNKLNSLQQKEFINIKKWTIFGKK